MGPLRILVADDQEAVRKRVCSTLAAHTNVGICSEATNGKEAVEKAYESDLDLIILDITMPILNGLEAARKIREFAPNTPILVLSVHKSKQLVEEAKKIGVQGYVTKTEAGLNLTRAVDAVLQNQPFFPTDL